MAVNVSALLLMAIGWLFRDWQTLEPPSATILLELAALVLVTWGGWMGGTLVYRNQIGVDHRYAEAGKWQETEIDGQPGDTVIIPEAEKLKVGQMMLVRVTGRRIVVGRTEHGPFALDDRCTHRGGALAGGVLACDLVCCPWHGSQFHVEDGSVESGPAEKPVAAYRIEESGNEIRLTLPT